MPYGLQAMLKEGHKHFSGLDEAVYKNIEAGKQLSQIARTSMGPNGNLLFCGKDLIPAAIADHKDIISFSICTNQRHRTLRVLQA